MITIAWWGLVLFFIVSAWFGLLLAAIVSVGRLNEQLRDAYRDGLKRGKAIDTLKEKQEDET